MKRILGMCALCALLALSSLGVQSCSSTSSPSGSDTTNTNNSKTDTSLTSAALNAILQNGTWYVSVYQEKTEDKASKFSDLSFSFNADGSLTITDAKSNSSEKGSWAYTPAVTYYGSSSKAAISLNAGSSTPQKLLTAKWNFVSASAGLISLDSPEVAEQLHLKFAKRN